MGGNIINRTGDFMSNGDGLVCPKCAGIMNCPRWVTLKL